MRTNAQTIIIVSEMSERLNTVLIAPNYRRLGIFARFAEISAGTDRPQTGPWNPIRPRRLLRAGADVAELIVSELGLYIEHAPA